MILQNLSDGSRSVRPKRATGCARPSGVHSKCPTLTSEFTIFHRNRLFASKMIQIILVHERSFGILGCFRRPVYLVQMVHGTFQNLRWRLISLYIETWLHEGTHSVKLVHPLICFELSCKDTINYESPDISGFKDLNFWELSQNLFNLSEAWNQMGRIIPHANEEMMAQQGLFSHPTLIAGVVLGQ